MPGMSSTSSGGMNLVKMVRSGCRPDISTTSGDTAFIQGDIVRDIPLALRDGALT
jgi:hypothetical protein